MQTPLQQGRRARMAIVCARLKHPWKDGAALFDVEMYCQSGCVSVVGRLHHGFFVVGEP